MLYDHMNSDQSGAAAVVNALLSGKQPGAGATAANVIDRRENVLFEKVDTGETTTVVIEQEDGEPITITVPVYETVRIANASPMDYAGIEAIETIDVKNMNEIPPFFMFGCKNLTKFTAENATVLCAAAFDGKDTSQESPYVSDLRILNLPKLEEIQVYDEEHPTGYETRYSQLTNLVDVDLGKAEGAYRVVANADAIRTFSDKGDNYFDGVLRGRTTLESVTVGAPFSFQKDEFSGCENLEEVARDAGDSPDGTPFISVAIGETNGSENLFNGCESLRTVGGTENVVSIRVQGCHFADANIFNGACVPESSILFSNELSDNEIDASGNPLPCDIGANAYSGCMASSVKTPYRWRIFEPNTEPGSSGVFVTQFNLGDDAFSGCGFETLQIRIERDPGSLYDPYEIGETRHVVSGSKKLKRLSLLGFEIAWPNMIDGCANLEDLEIDAPSGSLDSDYDVYDNVGVFMTRTKLFAAMDNLRRIYAPNLDLAAANSLLVSMGNKPDLKHVVLPKDHGTVPGLSASKGLVRVIASSAMDYAAGAFDVFTRDKSGALVPNSTLQEIDLHSVASADKPLHTFEPNDDQNPDAMFSVLTGLKKLDLGSATSIDGHMFHGIGKSLEELHVESLTSIPPTLFTCTDASNRGVDMFPRLRSLVFDNLNFSAGGDGSAQNPNKPVVFTGAKHLEELQIGGTLFTNKLSSASDLFVRGAWPKKLVLGPMDPGSGERTLNGSGGPKYFDSDFMDLNDSWDLVGLNQGPPSSLEHDGSAVLGFNYYQLEPPQSDHRLSKRFSVQLPAGDCPQNFYTRRRSVAILPVLDDGGHWQSAAGGEYEPTGVLQVAGCVEFTASSGTRFSTGGGDTRVRVQIIGSRRFFQHMMEKSGWRGMYGESDRFPDGIEINIPPGVYISGFSGTDVETVDVPYFGLLGPGAFMGCESLVEFNLVFPFDIDNGTHATAKTNIPYQHDLHAYGQWIMFMLSTAQGLYPVWDNNAHRLTTTRIAEYDMWNLQGDQFNGCKSMERNGFLDAMGTLLDTEKSNQTWIPGPRSFKGCASLDVSLNSLNPFTRMYDAPEECFDGCSSLCHDREIEMKLAVSIGVRAFRGTSIRKVVLPKCVVIGEDAFADSSVEEVVAPCLVKICKGAFRNTRNLVSVTAGVDGNGESLPMNVVEVGEEAFMNSGIRKFESPRLMWVGDRAFMDSGLRTFSARKKFTYYEDMLYRTTEHVVDTMVLVPDYGKDVKFSGTSSTIVPTSTDDYNVVPSLGAKMTADDVFFVDKTYAKKNVVDMDSYDHHTVVRERYEFHVEKLPGASTGRRDITIGASTGSRGIIFITGAIRDVLGKDTPVMSSGVVVNAAGTAFRSVGDARDHVDVDYPMMHLANYNGGRIKIGRYAFVGCGIDSSGIDPDHADIDPYAFNASTAWHMQDDMSIHVVSDGSVRLDDANLPTKNVSKITVVNREPGEHYIVDGFAEGYTSVKELLIEWRDGEANLHIGSRSFAGCKSVTKLSLAGMLDCKDDSFEGACAGLSSITVLDNANIGRMFPVNRISTLKILASNADNAWSDVGTAPKTVKTVELYKNVTKVGDGYFKDCKSLQTVLARRNVSAYGDVVGSESAQLSIGAESFSGCTGLFALEGAFDDYPGSGVVDIGDRAFYGCSNMDLNAGRKNVLRIGAKTVGNAFSGSKLSRIELVNESRDRWTVPTGAFENCVNLEAVVMDEITSSTCTAVGDRAFLGCGKLRILDTVPAGATTIGAEAYKGCYGTANSPQLDRGLFSVLGNVVEIGDGAFADLSRRSVIHGSGDDLGSVCPKLRAIGENVFRNALWPGVVHLGANTSMQQVTVGEHAFSGNQLYGFAFNGYRLHLEPYSFSDITNKVFGFMANEPGYGDRGFVLTRYGESSAAMRVAVDRHAFSNSCHPGYDPADGKNPNWFEPGYMD